ncbi:hypothetical protein NM688_g2043 [Phlebia brevispora]|uniref:Uncharacterized protein n=1 Tax=Phlebia brevispora TaxID=194682 RepID=A0ACC1T9M0_9APHY|nr:hypothetical protein NM688_g2043 [Phlebia brevispora]
MFVRAQLEAGTCMRPMHHGIYRAVICPEYWQHVRNKSRCRDPNLNPSHISLISSYFTTALLAIVCYEFIITFRHEYELVWQKKWTGATWMFLANRYLMLASVIIDKSPYSARFYVVNLIDSDPIHVSRCYNFPLQNFLTVLAELPLAIVAGMPLKLCTSDDSPSATTAFSALRVFALLGRAYVLAAFTFALSLVVVAVNLYQAGYATYYYVDDPILGSSCYYNFNGSDSIAFHLAGEIGTIAADVIAITITWIKTYRHVREAASIGVNASLSATLLRYGSLYFIVLFGINLLDGLIALSPSLTLLGPVNTFTTILPNIILSRFLISLRQINPPGPSSTARFSHFSVPNFHIPSVPSVIGNLGEPLADGEEDLDDENIDSELCKAGFGVISGSQRDAGLLGVADIDVSGIEEVRTPTSTSFAVINLTDAYRTGSSTDRLMPLPMSAGYFPASLRSRERCFRALASSNRPSLWHLPNTLFLSDVMHYQSLHLPPWMHAMQPHVEH